MRDIAQHPAWRSSERHCFKEENVTNNNDLKRDKLADLIEELRLLSQTTWLESEAATLPAAAYWAGMAVGYEDSLRKILRLMDGEHSA
jgi:hypothetical protein